MGQGAPGTGGPHWGWDGDEDLDGAVLTLLALAVVAAMALAWHWFGSGQDQEATGSEATAVRAQPPRAVETELAPHPKSKVSSGVGAQQQGSWDPPGPSQGSPAVARTQSCGPHGGGGLVPTTGPPCKTPGEAGGSVATGPWRGHAAAEGPRGNGRVSPRPGKARGPPAPILVHFIPRGPGRDAEAEVEAGQQAPGQAAEQDTGPWQPGARPPPSLRRRQGSGRCQVETSTGAGARHSPKLDALGLGTVVSVWDAVDAASLDTCVGSLVAGSQGPPFPHRPALQELPPAHAVHLGSLTNGSERGLGKSGLHPVPVLVQGPGDKAGGLESREAGPERHREDPGASGRASVEGWPWARREVLVTRRFSRAPGSVGPSPGGLPWGRPHSTPGQEPTEPGNVGKAGAKGPGDSSSLFCSEPGGTEKQGSCSLGEGRGSPQVQGEHSSGQAAGGQVADLGPGHSLDRGTPTPDTPRGISCCDPFPLATPTTNSPQPLLPVASSSIAHPHVGPPSTASALPPSYTDSLPLGVSQGPAEDGNFRVAPAPAPAPSLSPAPALVPSTVSAPAPAPAPSSDPASTPAPSPVPASAPAPSSAPASAPAPSPIPGPVPIPAPFPLPVPVPTPAPFPLPDPLLTSAPSSAPAPVPSSAPSPIPASSSAPASGSRAVLQEPSVVLSKGCHEGQVSSSWGNLIAMVLRSHPLPKQERPEGREPKADPESLADPCASQCGAENGQSGALSEGVTPNLGERGGSSVGKDTARTGFGAPQPGSSTAARPAGPTGDGREETALDSPWSPVPRPPSRLAAQSQPDPAAPAARPGPQPAPRRRTLSRCEGAESSQCAAAGHRPGEAQGRDARPAGSGGALTERQKEARKLMVFLQRPGSWGAVGEPRKRSSCPQQIPATATAVPRRLDLGNCLDALAFARQHGEPGLAQEAYAVMSANLLRVLGDPHLYRRLSGADRERILRLRTGRGQAVLGALMLPGPCQARWERLPRGPGGEEAPAPLLRTRLHVFDPLGNAWRPLTQVPEEAPLRGCGLCTMHNYLFLAGGIRGSGNAAVCSKAVFCYNPLTNIWSQVRPMQQARAQLKLVALEGLLYAIGGECLYSVERYDPRTDAWTSRAPLPAGTFPVAHEAVACRGDIYVTGGHLFYRLLRYSPGKDVWDECPYSASHRRCSDMVALGGFLYRFDLLRGVGAAVMRYNTVTRSWSRAARLPLPAPAPLRCAVLGSTIYCLNHQVTATFTVSEDTAQFQAKELQPLSMGSKGVLCPFILTLPSVEPLQTAL